MTKLTREEIESDHTALLRAVVAYCDLDQISKIVDAVIKSRPAKVRPAAYTPI